MKSPEKWPVGLEEKEPGQGQVSQDLQVLRPSKTERKTFEGYSEKRQENVDREIVIGCVHFCLALRCSHNESRTETGLDGVRQTKGSLNLKLLGKSFCCDR